MPPICLVALWQRGTSGLDRLAKPIRLLIGTWRAYDAGVLPDAERIDRLERQVQYLLRYVGVDPEIAAADSPIFGAGSPPAAASPEIIGLIRDGKLIKAIKLYRQMTGAGLKESKDAIDALRTDLGLGRRR